MPSVETPDVNSIDPTLDLFAEIDRLRAEKKAVILAHYYQDPDIQEIADHPAATPPPTNNAHRLQWAQDLKPTTLTHKYDCPPSFNLMRPGLACRDGVQRSTGFGNCA